MKAYRLIVIVVDFDDLGAKDIKSVIEHAHYSNRCIDPQVVRAEEADIGEWSDDHPLNQCGADLEALWREFSAR